MCKMFMYIEEEREDLSSPIFEYINNSKDFWILIAWNKSPSALPETAAASVCKLAAPGWRQCDVHGDCELSQEAFAFPIYCQ